MKNKVVYLFSANFVEYMIELANAMVTTSPDQTVVLSLPANRMTEKHRSLIDSKVIFEPFHLIDYKSVRANFKMLRYIASILKKHNPTVVHLQSNGLNNWWFLLPLLRGKKIVNTVHDPLPHSGDLVGKSNPRNTKLIFRRTDEFIVHGECLKTDLMNANFIPAEKITVIPHGHLGIFKQWREENMQREPATFLFFGRIWPYKGLSYFIEAANQLSRERDDVRFIIAGKGENIEKYTSYIQQLSTFEIYNERISEHQIDRLFQRAFCTVLPYTDATQSGVIPIAFAYQVLVIASNVGALPEVVEHLKNGLITEPSNAQDIYDKMKWALTEKEKVATLIANAEKTTKELLAWENIAKKTLKVYSKSKNK